MTVPDDDEFIGDWKIKGCYYYKDHPDYGGQGFYGTDGDEEDMQKIPDPPKYRPDGYDCNCKYIHKAWTCKNLTFIQSKSLTFF